MLSAVTFSQREISVLNLVADGLTNTQIGQQLHLSPATVKEHLRRMSARCGATNRAGLVAHGFRTGQLR